MIQYDFHRKRTYPKIWGSKLQRAVKWKMDLFDAREPNIIFH